MPSPPGKDADWTYLLSQPLLRDAGDGGSASLGHLADLFVERQHLIWKVGEQGVDSGAISS